MRARRPSGFSGQQARPVWRCGCGEGLILPAQMERSPTPPVGSVLLAYGESAAEALRNCGLAGIVMNISPPF